MANISHLPNASRVCGPQPPEPQDPTRIANALWFRINQAKAVIQCIQQNALGQGDTADLTMALAGAAFDQLDMALADISSLEASILR
jgi:hypothetical protein